MINKNEANRDVHPRLYSRTRVSWTAIFVGALIATGLGFLLNLFAVAIGLTVFTLNKTGSNVLAVGGFIGMIIGLIVSMLAAGYAAGYLGRWYSPRRNLGIVYGFTTWCVALLMTAVVSVHVQQHVTAYSTAITHSVSADNATPSNAEVTVATTPSNSNKNQSLTVQAPLTTLVWGAFIIFLLFFIGALASCFGACWGMACKRED